MKTNINTVSIGGTPGWASPEQTLGMKVSGKTDVYTMALVVALITEAVV